MSKDFRQDVVPIQQQHIGCGSGPARLPGITAIVTVHRRPQYVAEQFAAIRAQTCNPAAIWVLANEPDRTMKELLESVGFDQVVQCSLNTRFHGRFALALLAQTQYVAIFDDDTIPGLRWFENCLQTIERYPGILGTAGVKLVEDTYYPNSKHGWHAPSPEAVEVDLVGQAWFLRTDLIGCLFQSLPVTGTNGEDIELAARAWRTAGIRSFCPPHPPNDRSLWGSLRGQEYGSDQIASWRRTNHVEERNRIVEYEISNGWLPLWQRPAALAIASTLSESADANSSKTPFRPRGLLELIPPAARRILDVGCRYPELRASGQANVEIVGLALDNSQSEPQVSGYDQVLTTSPPNFTLPGTGGTFDCALCDRVLNFVTQPQALLTQLRQVLDQGSGRLLLRVPNVQHHSVVESLLEGHWSIGPGGAIDPSQLRFYTRREVEKLLTRAGFAVNAMHSIADQSAVDGIVTLNGSARSPLLSSDTNGVHVESLATREYLIEAQIRPRPSHGLTSIIVITHNQLAYTRECIAGLVDRTDEPYELIFVDNGSTDGTVEYLRGILAATVISNPDNRGFPAAVNQGLRIAKGEYILLLNNDTIVTTGWLRRLLDAMASDPAIGLVGPSSNCVSGSQQVTVGYEELSELDGFAWQWGKDNDRTRICTDRLVGFCLLIRRELINEVGDFDERFGLGNFEDDDYCLRAIRAGWRAMWAKDAFVHHFGERTFAGLGVDFRQQLETNQSLFREKWSGIDRRYAEAFPFKLSLCMIVRNNESTIRPCLESIRPWVDEMIVVDTGSEDRTPVIAQELGAEVHHFDWCDDFSAARNESLKYARGEWIFWMDSDDTITPENGQKLRELVLGQHRADILGYVMQVHCPGPRDDIGTEVVAVDHVKLLRNNPGLRFEGRIHEQILSAIRQAGGEVGWTDTFVVHSGSDQSEAARRRKQERDLRILKKDLAERPGHPFVLFNLGMTYADAGELEDATRYLQDSIAASHPMESHVRKAYALMVASLVQLRRFPDAEQWCQRGLEHFPQDIELQFRSGILAHERGDHQRAVASYLAVLGNREERHFSSLDRGITGFKTRHNLALVYEDAANFSKAEEQWRLIVEEVPRYRDGWRGLIENLLRQGRVDGAQSAIDAMSQYPQLSGEAYRAKAMLAQATGSLDVARQVLEQGVDRLPDSPEPLRTLCQFAFEHAPPADAKKWLERLTKLSPEDAAAHHNLGTVLLILDRPGEAVRCYRRALEIRPDAASTHEYLNYALKALGDDGRSVNAQRTVPFRVDPLQSTSTAPVGRDTGCQSWKDLNDFLTELQARSRAEAELV